MRLLLSLIFILTLLLNISAQESLKLFSNIELESTLSDEIILNSDNAEMISLGDNSESIIGEINNIELRILGDKDVEDLKKNGKYIFDDIEKKNLCPGPEVKELDDHHVMISINSNWMLDHDYRYFAANEDCNIFNHIHMLEEMESVLEDYEDWNKIVIAHHPIKSITELDGKGLSWLNIIPIYGQLRRSFKANSGNEQDMPHPDYHRYIQATEKIVSQFDKLVFISGHDRINSVIQDGLITHINVNSGQRSYRYKKDDNTIHISNSPSYLKIVKEGDDFKFYFKNENEKFPLQEVFQKRKIEPVALSLDHENIVKDITRASEKYKSTGWKNFWMGSGYRDVWSEPVKAPFLNIDNFDGGMKPYAIGGGLQTMSVKFKSNNGKKYAFRVLDKQPEKSLNEVLQQSIYKGIVQELITTMHPYAPLVASDLLAATDIIHIKPELYILDQNQNLGKQYIPFIGKIGTIEEKPKGKRKKKEGFFGADKVVTSYEMLLDLRKSHKNRIDKMAYAKARLMDMYIGDWDRHEDNWKWAMFKEGDLHIYRPIPKDRDHTFSHWTGVIPNIADVLISNAEDFDYKFGNLRQLNFKARYLDRQLSTEIDLKTWLDAVSYIQSKMTDEVIDNAILKFPEEVRSMHGSEIGAKLKGRRADLPRAMKSYYADLCSTVHVAASNKDDHIKVKRLENGDVLLNIFHISGGVLGESYYERKFEYEIVKEIYLFGLNGSDIFEVDGTVINSIPIRIVGGKGEDSIIDNSLVSKRGKSISVYDTYEEDKISKSKSIKTKHPNHTAHYDPYAFDFNWLIPNATIRISSGNGIGLGLGLSYLTRGFNKEGFVDKYDFKGIYYPELKAHRLEAMYTRKQGVGNSDFFIRSKFSSLFDQFPFFYGIGNDTEIVKLERREKNRIDYDYFELSAGVKTDIYSRSSWTNSLQFEFHDVENFSEFTVITPDLAGYGGTSFAGIKSKLKLDFTDTPLYPMDGSQFDFEVQGRTTKNGDLSGNIASRFAHYKTIDLGIKVTFAGSIHYKQAFGESNFYHLSRLGSQSHFKGYTRNRFIDRYAFLYNSELRFNLGHIKTPLIRFYVGVFAFYDGGQVWSDGSEFLKNEWNNSYGGGFFISPGWEQFAIIFTLAKPEDGYTYNKVQIGFDF